MNQYHENIRDFIKELSEVLTYQPMDQQTNENGIIKLEILELQSFSFLYTHNVAVGNVLKRENLVKKKNNRKLTGA